MIPEYVTYYAVAHKLAGNDARVLLMAHTRTRCIKLWEHFNPTISWLDAKKEGYEVKAFDIDIDKN